MIRTYLEVDEKLLERVKKLYGLPTNDAAIEYALRSLLPSEGRNGILELEGVGWDGDLPTMRRKRI